MKTLQVLLIVALMITFGKVHAQNIEIKKVEPQFWWVGMKNTNLQLVVYGSNIQNTTPSLNYSGVKLLKVNKVENPNYLFLDLEISPKTKPGKFEIEFKGITENLKYTYELKARNSKTPRHQGFSPADVVYLLLPDRFANGDPELDNHVETLEKADRNNQHGRHGGDIKGITSNLQYIADMGFTAIWFNPLLENNMPSVSYHGYAITDFYKIDPRFGTNDDYLNMVDQCHNSGLKVIMDMIFNHAGTNNYLIKDMPMKDWVHQHANFTRSNYRSELHSDPYRSQADFAIQEKGWFDVTMPDLNQSNPFVENYLTQNSIWWVEYANLDGIRMDTYPYPEKNMMARWAKRMMEEYPTLNIVGESWLQKEAHTAYWQKDFPSKDGYNSYLPCVTDFPLHGAMMRAFNEGEGWTDGMMKLYYTLSQDFLYPNPSNLLTFLDNHDLSRAYSSLNYNPNSMRMALGFLLTTRGIPQIYYGTEFLMDGLENEGHGTIRKDFPGGWEGDKKNAFTGKGLSQEEKDFQAFTKKLLNYRKNQPLLHSGNLTQFLPDNGVYVYFRHNDQGAVMVVLNNKYQQSVTTARYNEILGKYKSATDVMTGAEIKDLSKLDLLPKSILILELKK